MTTIIENAASTILDQLTNPLVRMCEDCREIVHAFRYIHGKAYCTICDVDAIGD